ncbi:MAG: hypothetical protein K2X08_01225 [Chlamydiales bacterium]|nr:hypothetical protein [Chlamydiales bacterium]MBY0530200.1 hypothetical protein [Rhabdochlamydiaceae bacterium]
MIKSSKENQCIRSEDKLIIFEDKKNPAYLLWRDASRRPDAENHRLLSRAPFILFSLDVDSAGAKAFCWWKKMYSQMKLYPSPVGKSSGDACLAGIDLWKWISRGRSEVADRSRAGPSSEQTSLVLKEIRVENDNVFRLKKWDLC